MKQIEALRAKKLERQEGLDVERSQNNQTLDMYKSLFPDKASSLEALRDLTGKGAVFSQFWPEVAGIADVADMTEFHFTTRPTGVAAIAATKAVGGKYAVSITIQGKAASSAAVTVTGLPKATKKLPASGKLTYSVSLTKGSSMAQVMLEAMLIMGVAFWMYAVALALYRVRSIILIRERHTQWVADLPEVRAQTMKNAAGGANV
jgi:hypothetical protein